jgi:hypothetical protein
MVRRIQADLRRGDVSPEDAREHLLTLSAIYGNCLQESIEADMAYNAVLLAQLDSAEKANRATIRAQSTPEYQRVREAKAVEKLVLTMTQSLKKVLASHMEDMKMAGYQR